MAKKAGSTTAHKKSIDHLRFLESALASVADGVMIVDDEERLVYVNDAGMRITQRLPPLGSIMKEQIVAFKLRHPDGQPIPRDEMPLARALSGQISTDFPLVLGKPDGTDANISVSASPIRDKRGGIIGAVATFRDVTELKRAEEKREQLLKQLNAQRLLFKMVFDNVPASIGLLRGPNLVYELFNPAAQIMWSNRLVLGKPLAEVLPELAPRAFEIYEHVCHTRKPYHVMDELRRIRRAPEAPLEEAYFTMTYVPISSPDGQVNAILALGIETTQQVLARKTIQRLAEVAQRRASELETIIESIADSVFVCDKEGRVIDVNEAGLKLTGLSTKDQAPRLILDFQHLLKLRHLDSRPTTAEEMATSRALRGDVVLNYEQIAQDVRTHRDKYLLISAAPIRNGERNIVGAVTVVSDITHIKEFDLMKDQFISVAAHELKTPIAIMKGYAQMVLRTDEKMPPQHRKAMEAINRGADRIDRIVRDLLDISRLLTGGFQLKTEKIDLLEMVVDVVNNMALATTKHRIRVVKARQAFVKGDRDRLEQVLVILLDNAIKYSPLGGDIDVEVDDRDRTALVSVRDRGVGIPEEKQKRIFERFYSAHAGTPYDYGGMGVGLYISKEIISLHGGRIWFESEEGKGSAFYFSLPLQGKRASK